MAAIISRAIIKFFKGIYYLFKKPKEIPKEETPVEVPTEEVTE
ncbi:MAG: hypothetical protein ACXAAM_09700 [Candidatus Heimdallarchaeaceae archaeon]